MQKKILGFFIFGVVELFALTKARFIFDFPHAEAALKPSQVENAQPALEEFPDASDSKPVEHQNCSCYGSVFMSLCECSAYVDDTSSGVKGNFTLYLNSYLGDLGVYLTSNENFVVYSYTSAAIPDKFTTFACGESQITEGHIVCFLIEGRRSRIRQKVTGRAFLLIDATSVFNLGCFSFNYQGANADGLMNASQHDATRFLELFDTEEKRRLIKERFLAKDNIPLMNDEML